MQDASVPVDVGKLIGLSLIDMGKGLVDKVVSLPGSAFEVAKQLGSFGTRDPNHTLNKLEMVKPNSSRIANDLIFRTLLFWMNLMELFLTFNIQKPQQRQILMIG